MATQKSLLNSTSPQRLSPQGPSKKNIQTKKVGKKEKKHGKRMVCANFCVVVAINVGRN